MSDDMKQCASTPAATLEQHITDPTVPKNEAGWWAYREITRLRAELATEREKFHDAVLGHSAETLKLTAERDELRAKAEQLSEAVWAMLKYMGDDEDRDDLLAPDEWVEIARDVRAALARIDAALNKGEWDE